MTEAIISSQLYDLVIHGHTHRKRDDKIGDVLVLNPSCAHRDFPNVEGEIETEPSIIIFYITKMSYQFIRLDDILVGNFCLSMLIVCRPSFLF